MIQLPPFFLELPVHPNSIQGLEILYDLILSCPFAAGRIYTSTPKSLDE